jgi:hypothetical protein
MAAVAQRAGFGGGSAGNRVGGTPGGAGAKRSPNGQAGIGGGEGATATLGNPAAQAGDGHGSTSAIGGPTSSGGAAAGVGGAAAVPVAAAAPMATAVAVVAAGSAATSVVGGQPARIANVSEVPGETSAAARLAPKVDTHATAPIAPT